MKEKEFKRIGDLITPPVEMPEEDIECPKHGIYRGKPVKGILFGSHEHISYPECPKCEEERRIKEAQDEAQRKKERELNRIISMNIGRRYWNTGFENFNAYNAELSKHLRIAENFAKNPDGKLVMLGENGSGKTHLAVSILKQTGGIIYTAFEIGVKLRQSYGGDSQEWKILQDLCETDMLVIDEIGRSKGSDFDLNWLSHVINKRHENFRPTILISNRHLRQDCPQGERGCEKCLEKFFDNDVISRIVEDGLVMKFTSEDYRKRNGEEYRNQKRAENANNGN
jgi:DNA replication protein DnaC